MAVHSFICLLFHLVLSILTIRHSLFQRVKIGIKIVIVLHLNYAENHSFFRDIRNRQKIIADTYVA